MYFIESNIIPNRILPVFFVSHLVFIFELIYLCKTNIKSIIHFSYFFRFDHIYILIFETSIIYKIKNKQNNYIFYSDFTIFVFITFVWTLFREYYYINHQLSNRYLSQVYLYNVRRIYLFYSIWDE